MMNDKGTLASSNVSRRVFSDSPDMPDTIEGAETMMNGTPSSYTMETHQRSELGEESNHGTYASDGIGE